MNEERIKKIIELENRIMEKEKVAEEIKRERVVCKYRFKKEFKEYMHKTHGEFIEANGVLVPTMAVLDFSPEVYEGFYIIFLGVRFRELIKELKELEEQHDKLILSVPEEDIYTWIKRNRLK